MSDMLTIPDDQQRFLKARRAYIEQQFARLNPQQREAVLSTEGPALLLAGAGSGKTTVLINRIANLVRFGRASDSDELPPWASAEALRTLESADDADPEELQRIVSLEPVEPWRILAITFTNKAAGELKARLQSMLGDVAKDIWAMTFHSACVRILRRDIEKVGFAPGFSIYDSYDSETLMKRTLKDMNLDEKTYPPRYVLSIISRAKDDCLTADDYLAEQQNPRDIRKKYIAHVYKRYEQALRKANAMDFDDLLLYTVKLLQDDADVREYYQRRFRYVLIDEYQDTNKLQYRFASLLSGGYRNICVVGDDDQSIYKFRGATIENILSFEQQYKDARVIRLEQNYRSTPDILAAANSVISNNTARKGKRLWTAAESGEKLALYTADNENDEALYVARRIQENFKKGDPWSANAVLYRMNAQSNRIEEAFRRIGVPYRVVGGMRFIDRAEVKDILAYMSVIVTSNDNHRLMRIVNNPPRQIGSRTVENVRTISDETGEPMLNIMRNADMYPDLSRSAMRLRLFVKMIDELKDAAYNMPLDEFYDLLLEKTGYIKALEAKSTDESISRIENVREVKTNILNYMREAGDEATLAGFLDEMLLYADLTEEDAETDRAVMMTIHSAKGLEFPNVFLVGAEEGVFPSARTIGSQDELEEERRLCYVAITRAKSRLHICHASKRMLFGNTRANELSRFIREIPEDVIEDVTFRENTSYSPRQNRQANRKTSSRSVLNAPAEHSTETYQLGDVIIHRAFGRGRITVMDPMGGDHLIEIEFEEVGKKRMMLRAASWNMTKETSPDDD